jgi:hypothetical protein
MSISLGCSISGYRRIGAAHTSPTDLGSIIYRCWGRALLYAKPVNSLKACLLWLDRVVQLFFYRLELQTRTKHCHKA